MANHVYHYMNISTNVDACQQEWDKLFTNYHEEVERPSYHGDGTITMREYKEIQVHPMFEGYSDDNWYNWGIENIGAKWAHIEDADDSSAYIVSAWSPIIPYLEALDDHLRELDEAVIISCQYEDEFRNFIGVWKNGDFDEKDGGELNDEFESKYNIDLSSDEFDWTDEHEESGRMYDELYEELVHEWFEEAHGNL